MKNTILYKCIEQGLWYISYGFSLFGGVISKIIPDYIYIKRQFKRNVGKKINLKNPQTFNEKVNWMKIYDHNKEYVIMADKYRVREYVSEKIGSEYLIPLLGVWDRFDDIDFERLPDKFVLKCTHDSGSVTICEKGSFDIEKTRKKFNKALKVNFYWYGREWVYKYIKPRIVAEEYIEDSHYKELRDYKFYCLNGKPHALLLATNRLSLDKELCFDYFDMNFKHLHMVNHWHPNSSDELKKPLNFELMQELAEKLAEGIPQVRIDFYEADGRVYFGECTFYDMAGYLIIHPDEWDVEWGKMIRLK